MSNNNLMKKNLTILLLLSAICKGQIITTIAGNGVTSGISGDGGPATLASINGANGGAFDKNGNYYVCDVLGHRVRMITPTGIITTVAGIGFSGISGDGGSATSAKLDNPSAVAIDKFGNIFINDVNNFKIRKIDVTTGLISTIAGTGTSGYNGDNIPASNAKLGGVQDICIDNSGNLYIADQVNFRVRKISTSGIITTVAGNGSFSSTGPISSGPATTASFNFLSSLAIDKAGSIYIGDRNANRVWRVNSSGNISIVAGNGNYMYIGDNIPATNAQLNPVRLTFSRGNELVIADKSNLRVLKVDDLGIIHNIAGNGMSGYSGDGVSATASSLDFPAGVIYDTCGNLYIAESTNRRVRKVSFNPDCIPMAVPEVMGTTPTIYPNPATATVTINAGVAITHISISNAVGQQVLELHSTGGKKSVNTNVQHLPAGIYVVMVNGLYAGKMVKGE
jgi:hypothetical protein